MARSTSKSDPAGTLKARGLTGDKDQVQVSKDVVPVQDPPNDPPRAEGKKGVTGEGDPARSPALAKADESLVLENPAEPSRADTVLKDAGRWPTDAHNVTTTRAFADLDEGIVPEQSPPPKAPVRTQTIRIEAPEGARVTRGT